MATWCWKGCCNGFVMLVATHGRYDTGSGVYSTVTAWDGTGSTLATPPSSALWKYDLGQTAAGNDWVPGHPKIDPDGNVYVPYIGKTQDSPRLNGGGMIKLDVSGALQWDYAIGTQTHPGADVPIGFQTIPRCQIMSNGNIVFTHRKTDTGSYFMTIVDPDGTLVTQIVPPSSATVGFTVDGGVNFPTFLMELDGSDNIYFPGVDTSSSIVILDSSGSYINKITTGYGLTNALAGWVIDKATNKLFGTVRGYASTATNAVMQMDLTSLTADWTLTLADLHASASSSTSSNTCYTVSLSPDGSRLYIGALLVQSPSTVLATLEDIKANVSSGSKGVNDRYISGLSNVSGTACDPVTGDRFAYQNASSSTRILKFQHNGSGFLEDIWQFFNPTGTIFSNGVMGLDARTV